MASSDPWNDKINIFYEDDGENFSSYIKTKLTSENYRFCVMCYKLTDLIKSVMPAVCVFILTDDSVPVLKEKGGDFFKSICPESSPLVILNHAESTGMTDNNVEEIMTGKGQSVANYKVLSIGNDENFKKSLMKIIAFADSSDAMPVLKTFTLVPRHIWTESDAVLVIFKRDKERNVVQLKVNSVYKEEIVFEAKKVQNSSVFKIIPEGIVPGHHNIEVIVDGQSAGKDKLVLKSKVDLLSTLLHDVVNPIELMCQALKLDIGKENLDLEMTDILTNGGGWNPMAGLEGINNSTLQVEESKCEYPTLLHFGAKYGLTKFCLTLLTYPGAVVALKIKNKDGKTPCKLAVLAGWTDLASRLQSEEENLNDDVFEGTEESPYMSMNDLQLRHTSSDLSDVRISDEVQLRKNRESKRSTGSFTMKSVSSTSTQDSGYLTERMTERMTIMWNDNDIPSLAELWKPHETICRKSVTHL